MKKIRSALIMLCFVQSIMLMLFPLEGKEYPEYANFCSLCVMKNFKYCKSKCYDLDYVCPDANAPTRINQCTEQNVASKNPYICNRVHTITSLNRKRPTNLEGSLKGGEWCQFMLYDNIFNTKLKNTIANWTINRNSSDNLTYMFYETNSTDKLTNDL